MRTASKYVRVRVGTDRPDWRLHVPEPNVTNPLLDPDFKTKYAVLGRRVVRRQDGEDLHRKQDRFSTTATGASGDSVFTIGFRYDFPFRISHQ